MADVLNVSVKAEAGAITGYLYMPDSVNSSHPAPGIVISHGATSSIEVVEAWPIE